MLEQLFELMPEIYNRADEMEMFPVLKAEGVKCMIYGAGNGGKFLTSWMKHVYGILPDFLVDRQPQVKSIEGVPVVSVEEWKKMKLDRFFVLIAVTDYHSDKNVQEEIKKTIAEAGEGAEYLMEDGFDIFAPFDLGWYQYVKEHISSFEDTYGLLKDECSKDTFLHYLRVIILGERYSGRTFPEKYKYWGIDSDTECLFRLSEDEVLLNIGAARGDTVFQYLKCKNPYKKIIAVEAEQEVYRNLKRNIGFLKKETKEKIQLDHYFLGAGENTIDNLYAEENISLLNMDIEGAELDVLKTGVKTIQDRRPILAVCAYHKKEDLIEIPRWIEENLKNYVIVLRKYPSCWYESRAHILQQIELVLYAIPRERYIGQRA